MNLAHVLSLIGVTYKENVSGSVQDILTPSIEEVPSHTGR
jgi:hypothetical protein